MEIAAHPVRVLPLVAAGLAALLLLQLVQNVSGVGGKELDTFVNDGVHNFLLAASAAACLIRAFLVERGRMTWLMFGLSLASFAVGDITWTLLYEGQTPAPVPTLSDVF
jgi:hypothetical protein